MLRLIKQVLAELFTFSGSLATRCTPLNDELCMISPTLFDLNLV